jgi:hypothetical protein
MTNEHPTASVTEGVMNGHVAPDRFLAGNRCWIPRWRFQPANRIEDAFGLLQDGRHQTFGFGICGTGAFPAEVRIRGRVGQAQDESEARAITLAVARAPGLGEEGQ